jgi:cell wall-associated NlpC family hydrolase
MGGFEMDFKIGVIGFGSLVNNLRSDINGCSLEARRPRGTFPSSEGIDRGSPFMVAEGLKLPIRLGRISSRGTPHERVTLVLAKGASDEQVYIAESMFNNLNEAIKNLRQREGISEEHKDDIGYVNLRSGTSRSRLDSVQRRIEDWAREHHFDAIVWTDLPTKGINFDANSNGREVLPLLATSLSLLENTQKYIHSLPVQNRLQKEILQMQPAPAQEYHRSLTADFNIRDAMPQTNIPQEDWFKPQYGIWGPPAKKFPVPAIPNGVNASQWKRDRIIEVAKHYKGLKYKNNDGKRGHFPSRNCGLDCSNFVSWVYNYGLGMKLNSDVDNLWSSAAGGRLLAPREAPQKGDLLFFDTDPRHVVIYIDEHHVIDSTSLRPEGVQVRDIREERNKRYRMTNPKFLGSRRLIEN